MASRTQTKNGTEGADRSQTLLVSAGEIREVSRVLVRQLGFLEEGPRGLDATHAACHALIELGHRPPITASALAALLRLDKSTVSRLVRDLSRRGWVTASSQKGDGRKRLLALTKAGQKVLAHIHESATKRVVGALSLLSDGEQEVVTRGLRLYARALTRAKLREEYALRPIDKRDDADVAALIRTVMPEFGAKGPGFAIEDPEVDRMSAAYRGSRSAYFVLERRGRLVGAGGFAPLVGGPRETCELRKMYFFADVRGLGLGEMLLERLLAEAKAAGFRRVYLETLENMTQARRLYEKFGFRRLTRPRGDTGHFGCNAWYELALEAGSAESREGARRRNTQRATSPR